MSKSVKRVVKNSFFQTFGAFGLSGLNFILIMGYGRILGPELFGSLATSQNQVIIWSMLVDLGLSHSLIGALTLAESGRSELSRQGFRARDLVFRVLVLRILGASFGSLGVYLLAKAHNPQGGELFWQSLAFLPYLFALGLQQTAVGFALYRGRQGMAVLSQIAGFSVSVALTLLLATQGTSITWLLLSQSWGGFLGGGLIFGIFFIDSRKRRREGNTRRLERAHGGPWGKEAWGALLREALPYSITYAVFVIWQRLDQLAVSHFLGHEQGGQYAMAVRLVAIPLLVATSISLAIFPDLQRIGRDAPDRVRVVLGFATKIIWRYGIMAAAIMLVAIAVLVIPLQPQFKPAFKLLPYFVPGVWAFWMQSFLMNALFGVRRYRLVVELHLISLVVYVGSIYALTRWFGMHGAVWAFNLFCLTMSLLGFRAARKAGLLEKNYSLFGAFSPEEQAIWRQGMKKVKSL